MKRFYTILLFLFASQIILSQPYGNEWIDYTLEYFKIDIAEDALYKIDYNTLVNKGMTGTIVGSDLKLIARGNEVSIYVSEDGVWDGDEFLYFWGKKNDGWLDKRMYADPEWHHSDDFSAYTDTIAYYLTRTIDGTQRLRLNEMTNNLTGPLPEKEAYFKFTSSLKDSDDYFNYYRGNSYKIHPFTENSAAITDTIIGNEYWYITDSKFQENEGIIKKYLNYTPYDSTEVLSFLTPHHSEDNLECELSFKVSGRSRPDTIDNNIEFSASMGEVGIVSDSFDEYAFKEYSESFMPDTELSGISNVKFEMAPNLGNYSALYSAELHYNRSYSLLYESKAISLSLNSSDDGHYLEFRDAIIFPQYILIDSLNSEIYFLNTDSDFKLSIFLPPTDSDRDLVLIPNNINSQIVEVSDLSDVSLFDYKDTFGNFIMLSHPHFASGSYNYLDFYAQNLSLIHNNDNLVPVTIDVTKLYDQFSYGIRNHPLAIKNFIRYARKFWEMKPEYLFIIGTGVQTNRWSSLPSQGRKNYVPTWGNDGSDIYFSSDLGSPINALATGRLSITTPDQLNAYFNKVIAHNDETGDNSWRTNVAHLVHTYSEDIAYVSEQVNEASNYLVQSDFNATLFKYPNLQFTEPDTFILDNGFNDYGLGLITTYSFGTFDSGSIMDHPSTYEQDGRYPVILCLGPNSADVFNYYNDDYDRFIPELFVNYSSSGAIASLAFTGWYYSYNEMPNIATALYKNIGIDSYGLSLGEQMNQTISDLYHPDSLENHLYLNNWVLFGDPAIRLRYLPPPVGIEEEEKLDIISVSPNPFTDEVILSSEVLLNKDILIYDSNGAIIKKAHSFSNIFTWDGTSNSMKECPSGVYQISIKDGKGIIAYKTVLKL